MSEHWNNCEAKSFIEELEEPQKRLIKFFIKKEKRCLKQEDILKYMNWGPHKLKAQKGLISKACKKIDKKRIIAVGKGKGDERIHCMDEDVYKCLINK